jgi:hypothetical protein
MNDQDATAYINSRMYKPGWEIGGRAYGGVLRVRVLFDAPDSSLDYARRGYPYVFRMERNFDMAGIGGMSRDELDACVFARIIAIEHHEAAEFWRDAVTLAAPYHPHRVAGRALENMLAAVGPVPCPA